MPKILFQLPDGSKMDVAADNGITLMEAARAANVSGIDANCGGACACSTCHVYVDPEWVSRFPSREDMEADMLDFAIDPDETTSRLACQLKIDDSFNGLLVRVPNEQAP
ncbi:2Fe-2S iron-sulfur cluster-binding protein [Tropicibacter sp. Alg240-R139]|uniref:2Fe-2S iron-sulfur cluster-binding protein n=1 Tax=Tropicibacter sp. Alg240-R139 TaxID=2305991 RepID=UPI0013E00A94|nr:2Fe-2S iron-sulfur cluster-binding protein [Tropicibacter sp. Alg240-R139]